MPKNPYSGSTFQSAHSDLELFVGREAELQELRSLIAEMCSDFNITRIINVFGTAGSGKSSLLYKLRDDIELEKRFHPVLFNIDADTFDQNISAPELLWQLRISLRRAGVRTPLYDLYYATYFSKYAQQRENLSLSSLLQRLGAKAEAIDKASSIASSKVIYKQLSQVFDSEIVRDMVEGTEEFARSLKGVQLVTMLASAFQNKARRRALQKKGIDLSTSGTDDVDLAPEILASDLLEFESKFHPIVIFVDGFDRIQTKPQILRGPAIAEKTMETLVRYLMFGNSRGAREKIAFVYFGRQPLRWAELFDQSGDDDSWNKYVRQIPLHGFTQAEAKVFLAKADAALDAAGDAEAAQALRSSKKTLLSVSRDQTEDLYGISAEIKNKDTVRYSPFRLRLCIEEIRELKRPFSDDDARRHADDICASFLRGVPERLREVVHVFALAGEMDDFMYQTLVKESVIRNYPINEFQLLMQRGALFAPAVRTGAYRLHFQLETAALTLLAQNVDSRQVAATITAKIFNQYLQLATPPSYALLIKDNLDAFQQAMRLTFRVYETGLLSIDRFAIAFLELEETLDFDLRVGNTMHINWILRLCEQSAHWNVEDGKQLVESQLKTRNGKRARQIIQLMIYVFHKEWMNETARKAAKSMFTRMYQASLFPPIDGKMADEDTVTTLAVMSARTTGKKLAREERFDEAEAVLWECMQSLPETLQTIEMAGHIGNLNLTLAQVAIGKKDKVSAEAYLEQALLFWSMANPDPTAWADSALEYCKAMLFVIRKEEPAAALFSKIAPVLEAELPAMHPTRADLSNILAMLFLCRGYSELALPYFQEAKQVLVENYGEKDQRVHAQQSLIDGLIL